jgi:general secretion pathway protein F
MASFAYTAVDTDGREKQGSIEAASEAAARSILSGRNLLPVRVQHAAAADAQRRTRTRGSADSAKLSHRERVLVTRQLATLVDASVSVDDALGTLAAQEERATVRRIVSDLRQDVQEGMRLADAMGRRKESFPGAYRAAVAGGERSGKLGPVLKRLSDHLAREQALRSKITTAMVYPAALLIIATGVICALMIFVVPTLIDQFTHLNGKLPLPTQILIAASRFLSAFWPMILLGLALAILLLMTALKQPAIRLAFDLGLLKLPLIGKWIGVVNASRFIRSIALMTSSGLPIPESVRVAREAAPNRYVARQIAAMATHIEEGEPLSHALRRSGVVPPLAVYMAVGGEGSGELPLMLEKAADHLDEEFEAFIQVALSLVEPIIILIMGGLVAGIILAIMLPILQLNQLVGV